MGERPPSRSTRSPQDPNALDEADPHAGDDADWEDAEPVAEPTPAPEPDAPLLFWRGVVIGALFSAVIWVALGAAAYTLVVLLAD